MNRRSAFLLAALLTAAPLAFSQSITSLQPSSAPAGSGQLTLTINGTFLPGNFSPVVHWFSTATNSDTVLGLAGDSTTTQVTAIVPYFLLGQVDTAQVYVVQNSVTTNALIFTVTGTNLISLSPNSAVAGSPQLTMTVNGSNFDSAMSVLWNGSSLATTFINSGQLTATVPAALLTTPGTAAVGVNSTPPAPTLTFTILTPLGLTGMSPTGVYAGSPPFLLTVNGSGFTSGTSITWNGSPLTTNFIGASQLTTTVPANLVAAPGTAAVSVAASGYTSPAPLTFTISLPTTTLTSLSPSSAVAGSPQLMLIVNGTNFPSGEIPSVTWNGSPLATTYNNSSQLTATVPASLLTTPGTASVSLNIPVTPTSLTFTILAPLTLTSLSPNNTNAGSPPFLLTVNGSGFTSGTSITWNGSPLTTNFVGATQLTTTVPANLVTTAGTASVTVAASGYTSPAPLTFTINAAVTLTSLSPSSAVAGSPQLMLIVNGTNFPSGATPSVTWNGSPLATSYNSSSQLTATVPASLLTTPGTASVSLNIPVTPPSLTFTILAPLTLTSLSPNNTNAGSPPFLLTVNGSGFTSGTSITWNGSPLTTNFVGATQLTTTVPANLVTTAGTASVTVAASGYTSPAPLTFTINAAVTLTSLSPSSAVAGSPQLMLIVNGTNFPSGATPSVTWNGSPLATTYNNSSQLTATVPASLLTTPGTASVGLNIPVTPTSLTFTILAPLTLTSLSPNNTNAGSPPFLLTVNGSGFTSGTSITWNGSPLTTNFVGATQLTTTVPANLVTTAGTASVTVAAAGYTSPAPLTFTINAAVTLTSLSPSSAVAGSPQLMLTVNGTNFPSGAIPSVTWNGSPLATSYNSSSQLTATVPASLLTTPGTALVSLNIPVTPASLTFTILAPLTLTSLSPNNTNAGSPPFLLTVNGSGFTSGTSITWNGSPLTTNFVGATQLTTTVPANLVTTAGTASVTVAASGYTSPAPLTFTINAAVTLTSLSPSSAVAGSPQLMLIVNGTNFPSGATPSVTWNGSPLATAYNNSSQLTATVPASLLTTPGTASVSLNIPVTPTSLTFTILAPLTLTSLSPNNTNAGSPPFLLTVNGSGFTSGTSITWNGSPLTTNFVGATQLTTTVPANLVTTAGTASVTVAASGYTSPAPLTFTINAAVTLTSLSPSSAVAGSPQLMLIVNGTNFPSGATPSVTWNGSPLATTYNNSSQLTATVPASLLTTPGTASVSLNIPVTPASLTFTILAPLTLTSLSPNNTNAGSPPFLLTVNGSGFTSGTSITWNGSPLTTNFVGATQLTTTVPANLVTTAGTASVTVAAAGYTSPAPLTFTINAGTTLTSLSPSSAVAGSPQLMLIVNGTNFPSGATPSVTWNGSPLATTYNNSSQLTATVPASLLTTPGTASVSLNIPVTPPSLTFTILAPLTITSLSPSSVTAGFPAFTLTVSGSGFTSGTSITWNGSPLSTNFGSSTQLTTTVPANLVTTAGTASVTVAAAGYSSPAPLTFTINPAPTLTSLSPTFAIAGSPTLQLTVNGSNFSSGTSVTWNGSQLATTFVNGGQLTATVPSTLLTTTGTASVNVTAQVQPQSLTFNIVPPLALTSLSPPAVTAGSAAFTLTVNGSGFSSSTTIIWNGSSVATNFVNATQLTTTIPANFVSTPGTASVGVAALGYTSPAPLTFTINAGATLTSLSPNYAVAGSPALTLAVNGSSFSSGTAVTWNGTQLSTTFVSSAQLTANVPAALLTTVGTALVNITSQPQPQALVFTIVPPLSLTSLTPASIQAGSPAFSLAVNGAGFTSASTVTWNGSPLSTGLAGSTMLTATVPANLIATAGTASVGVTAPGEVSPSPLPFVITPALTLTSLLPSSAVVGGPAFTLALNGTGFTAQTTALWNGSALSTTFVNGNLMTANVPANLIAQVGSASVTAQSPTGVSNPLAFNITNVQPLTLTSIFPNSAVAGGPAFNMTVSGTGFSSSTVVTWNGSPIVTTFVSSMQLTAAVPANLIATAGMASVGVTSPGQTSPASLSFTITSGITITSIAPSSATAGGPTFTLTVNGSLFGSATVVFWNDTALATTPVNAGQLSATVPANLIAQPGSASITAQSGNVVSNAANFTITSQGLSLTSISPSTAAAGSPTFTLTANGSGFTGTTVVTWNGAQLTTVVVSDRQLTATVPANLVATAGTASVGVSSPEQTSPPALSFVITQTGLTLTSLSPSTAVAGSAAFTLTVNGTGFTSATQVNWNGQSLGTALVNANQLSATVPANLLTQAGSASVMAQNGNQPSNALPFTITATGPTLTLTSLSPATAIAGSPGFSLTVTGSGFTSGTVVTWNGSPLSTGFVTNSQLTATVTADLVATAGTASVDVTALNQSSPAALPFVISQSGLFLTGLSPASALAGGPAFNLTVTGAGFGDGTIVLWNGGPLSTTVLSANLLTATVPANLIALQGFASITAQSGSQISNPLTFFITTPPVVVPISLISLSPNSAPAGSPAFTLVVNGSGFPAGTIITWNGTLLATNFVSSGQLTAVVPPNLLTTPETAAVSVTGQPQPASLPFIVTNSVSLISIAPATVGAGGPAFTLTANGSGFINTTTVTFNGSLLATTFVSPSQLTAVVPASFILSPGTASIDISVPAGQTPPPALPLVISQGGFFLTSLAPSSASVGAPAFTLTVTGSGFASGATVFWNGVALATTFVSPTQLTGPVSANLIAQLGSASVTVNSGGAVSNALTFAILPVGPVITSITPSSTAASGPPITVTVIGTGFQSGAVVSAGNTPLSTTFISATQVTAVVPPALTPQSGALQITLANPSGPASNAVPLTITLPTPVITSISPSNVAPGSPAFTLSVTGTGFASGATVFFNGLMLNTSFISATQLSAAVTADLLTQPGTAQITAANPGTASSNAVGLTIGQAGPVITSVSPPAVAAGGTPFTLIVTGTGFVSGSTVSFNGTALNTTFISATQLTAAVPASLLTLAGTAQVTAANPGGMSSNAVNFTIGQPGPTITSISPSTVAVGAPAFTLTVVGTNFVSGASVSFNATALSTTFVSATQLAASVPASLLTLSGTAQISAANPGGLSSNSVNFIVGQPGPAITSISPAVVAAGGPAFTLNVTGTGFLSGVTVSLNGTALSTTFGSATQLTAAVPASLITKAGTALISAANPNGLPSNSVKLTIGQPGPTITSISPATVAAGGPSFTLTVNGTGFLSGATVAFNGISLGTSFVSDTQLTAGVAAGLINKAGVAQITASNPGSASSNAVGLVIGQPPPTITSISPASVTAGGPSFTLTINGTGFVSGATVSFNSTGLNTSFVSDGQLTAAVPASLITQAGTAQISASNPGSGSSNAVGLVIALPGPSITGISPASVTAGGPSFTLTVNGTGFLSGAGVSFNSTGLSTSFVSATQLTAAVPASLITQVGTAQITASNPGTGSSNAATLTINPAPPALTSISPISAKVGDPTFTLSLTGTGFVQGSVAQWDGSALSTTFVSTTQLTATVAAARLVLPATASVTVANPSLPDGTPQVSNAVTFTINPVIPAITSISPASANAGDPAFSLTVNGSGFLSLTAIQWNTTTLSTHFISDTQVTADVPATLIAQAGTASVTAVNPGNNSSGAVTFTINPQVPAAVLSSLSKSTATAGDGAFTLTVTGTGFSSGSVVNFDTTPLATTFVSATQLTAAVPANLLQTAGTFQIVVQQGGTSSNALTFTVIPTGPPSLRLNPPATAGPGQQPTVDFGLNSPYPVPLTATVTLTFASTATIPVDDPMVVFTNGTRTFTFVVPANTTALPTLQIQTGTVAGVITLKVTLTAGGVDVTPPGSSASITIGKSAPVIRSVTLVHANGFLEVDVTGFSTTRDMTTAVFHLNAVPGGTFTSSDITVTASSLFTTWYQNPASAGFGSQFTYAQQFNVIGDTNQIQSVTVTLTNSAGTSVSVTSN